MRIAKIHLRNVYGIDEFDLDAGAFNLISGPNGSGKTSALRALRSLMRGGEEALLVKQGETDGEAVIVLDNGTVITKRVTPQGERPPSMEVDGVRAKRPVEAIKALSDALSVNPVEFLKARPKDRLSVLMEAMPMAADVARIREIMGDDTFSPPAGSALDQIKAAYDAVYSDRTATNRAVKEKEASINQLEATLPRDSGGAALDAADGEVSYQTRLDNMDAGKDAEFERIKNKLDSLRATHQAEVQDMREDIAKIQESISRKIEAFAETERLAATQRERVKQRWQDDRAPVVESLNAIRQNRDMMVRAAATNETIKTFRDELKSLNADADRQTAALEAFKAYKTELLANLPIPGLEVTAGEIYRDGVAFDDLNKAQQVEIAFEIAKLRAGELGVLCVDEMESLDSEHFAAFEAQAISSGLQLFVTRVSDGPFAARAAG